MEQEFSPVPQSEDKPELMSFSEAILDVISGQKITKQEWNDPKTYVFLHGGFLCIHHSKDPEQIHHVLKVSEGDMVGEDWFVLKGEAKN